MFLFFISVVMVYLFSFFVGWLVLKSQDWAYGGVFVRFLENLLKQNKKWRARRMSYSPFFPRRFTRLGDGWGEATLFLSVFHVISVKLFFWKEKKRYCFRGCRVSAPCFAYLLIEKPFPFYVCFFFLSGFT